MLQALLPVFSPITGSEIGNIADPYFYAVASCRIAQFNIIEPAFGAYTGTALAWASLYGYERSVLSVALLKSGYFGKEFQA